MIVALDYPSIQDVKEGKPLSGYPASLYKIAARYAGLGDVEFVSLFPQPPMYNNPSSLFHKKKGAPDDAIANPIHKTWGYLRSDLRDAYDNLRDRCRGASLVVTMGDLALWCLTGEKLTDHRGTILYADDGTRIIPTHNPREVVRDHSLLPILAMDLKKAWQESQKKTSTFPRRAIHLIETVEDAEKATASILTHPSFAFDIETDGKQDITMICFAPSPRDTYVIPLIPPYKDWGPDSPRIWDCIARLMDSPLIKIAHNAVFDLTYLVMKGIPIRYPVEDTMLISHSNEIEWPKSLGFLGSIYCNEKSWKLLRVGKKKDRNKPDE